MSMEVPGQDNNAAKGDDEEEVFFGPVGFREKCAAVVVADQVESPRPLSPLSASDMVEVFKQAHTVAYYIRKTALEDSNRSDVDSPVKTGSGQLLSAGDVDGSKHECTVTPMLEVRRQESEGPGLSLPTTPMQLPEGKDGIFRSATAPSDEKPRQESASRFQSGLMRRGGFRNSVGRSNGGLRPGAGHLPRVQSPAPDRRLLKTPVNAVSLELALAVTVPECLCIN